MLIFLNTAEVMIVVSKGFSSHVLILIIWSVQQCNSLLLFLLGNVFEKTARVCVTYIEATGEEGGCSAFVKKWWV